MAKFTPRKPEKRLFLSGSQSAHFEEIDQKAAEIGISRNELINQMIMYALPEHGKWRGLTVLHK